MATNAIIIITLQDKIKQKKTSFKTYYFDISALNIGRQNVCGLNTTKIEYKEKNGIFSNLKTMPHIKKVGIVILDISLQMSLKIP